MVSTLYCQGVQWLEKLNLNKDQVDILQKAASELIFLKLNTDTDTVAAQSEVRAVTDMGKLFHILEKCLNFFGFD